MTESGSFPVIHDIDMGYSSGWKITKKKCQMTMASVASQAS